jgi:hypothetical protein
LKVTTPNIKCHLSKDFPIYLVFFDSNKNLILNLSDFLPKNGIKDLPNNFYFPERVTLYLTEYFNV